MKLGRKAIKTDSRTLRLGKYLTAALPAPPASCDWTKGVASFGEMLNDQLGDCTIAACGHAIQIWSLNADNSERTIPDSAILAAYEAWDGYVQGDPSTDTGGVCLDVLNAWKKDALNDYELQAFADPTVSNLDEIRQAIALFGGVYIGFNVPNFIMATDTIPPLWDVAADDGGNAGGHCVFVVGYDESTFSFISWGSVYKMTAAFWTKYVDEAHALLATVWLTETGAPSGFNLQQLTDDLAAIR
jgi:hypothetical protein